LIVVRCLFVARLGVGVNGGVGVAVLGVWYSHGGGGVGGGGFVTVTWSSTCISGLRLPLSTPTSCS